MWCWWCCHPIECTPLSMPFKHNEKKQTFITVGSFCSWSCMKAYALDTYGVTRGSIICGNMIMMRKKQFGKIGSITPAPNRYRLVEFGGDLTIEKFRENLLVDEETSNEIKTEPLTNIVVPVSSNGLKMYEINNATTKNEPLRLKREKPHKHDQNNLETVLGLKIKTNN